MYLKTEKAETNTSKEETENIKIFQHLDNKNFFFLSIK